MHRRQRGLTLPANGVTYIRYGLNNLPWRAGPSRRGLLAIPAVSRNGTASPKRYADAPDVKREVQMAVRWQLSGSYFENCSCDVVCPCLLSTQAQLTSKPTKGFCDVGLAFHIDKGNYGDVPLDGLSVAMVAHTPGPMANGNWTAAAYIDERADDRQTEALGAIFTGAAGGVGAHDRHQPRRQEGADRLPGRRQEAVGGDCGRHADGGRAAADNARGRADVGGHRPSHQSRLARFGDGVARQYIQRPGHELGQFRPERTLRPDQLVWRVVVGLRGSLRSLLRPWMTKPRGLGNGETL